jgi:hypothetical protein
MQHWQNPPDEEEGHEAAQEAGRRKRLVAADAFNAIPLQEEQKEGRALIGGRLLQHLSLAMAGMQRTRF